jgi:RNA polymerase sigma-70 factor (ECF subfamily)
VTGAAGPCAADVAPGSAGVITRFERELAAFITRRVPGPDADDVLQDTLLRLHLGIGGLRAHDRLAPWVYRVARSAIIDHHRRRRVASRRTGPDADGSAEAWDTLSPEAMSPEPARDARRALAACVAPFLEGLPAEQAEALRLTDLGGLSQAEAARRLGVPLPTLKARVQRGRRRMRDAFEACCVLVQDARGAVIAATPRCGCAGVELGG